MGGMREVILSSTVLQTIRKVILILCLRIVLELSEDFSFDLFVLIYFYLLVSSDYCLYLSHFQIWEV